MSILRHLAKNSISFSQAPNSYCEKGQYNDISKTGISQPPTFPPCIKSIKLYTIFWPEQEHDLCRKAELERKIKIFEINKTKTNQTKINKLPDNLIFILRVELFCPGMNELI